MFDVALCTTQVIHQPFEGMLSSHIQIQWLYPTYNGVTIIGLPTISKDS